ncbi:hypothetical protein [Bacteroides fragilis]|uniref:hypothetical protein n=1 Tax=Bacteroides fragilis TaxID=817 RepID=UPI00216B0C54|nr:hypothetical protein [Bacteroides fragilis]UVP67621.1 hypothetical protein NXW69_15590 [Bacteroides fragilis]
MAIILKDRNEKVTLNGSVYELTLLWNREDIRRCCFGMPHPNMPTSARTAGTSPPLTAILH